MINAAAAARLSYMRQAAEGTAIAAKRTTAAQRTTAAKRTAAAAAARLSCMRQAAEGTAIAAKRTAAAAVAASMSMGKKNPQLERFDPAHNHLSRFK